MPSSPSHALDNVRTLDNVKDSAAPADALSRGNALTSSSDQAVWKDAQASGGSADLTRFGFSNFSIDGMDTSNKAETGEQASYTVQKGDSLWSVAEKQLDPTGRSLSPGEQGNQATEIESLVKEIASENNISNPNLLTPGEQLKLPSLDSKSETGKGDQEPKGKNPADTAPDKAKDASADQLDGRTPPSMEGAPAEELQGQTTPTSEGARVEQPQGQTTPATEGALVEQLQAETALSSQITPVEQSDSPTRTISQGDESKTFGPNGRRIEISPDGTGTYTVQDGDSLWAIARDVLTAPGQVLTTDEQAAMAPEIMQMVDQIARDNGISDPSQLQPGEELTIGGIKTENLQSGPSGELQSAPPEVSASEPSHSLQSGWPYAPQSGQPEVSPSSPSSNPPESSSWYTPLEKAATSLWQSVEEGIDKSAENLIERAFDHLHLGF